MISLDNKNSNKSNTIATIDNEISLINYFLDTQKKLNKKFLTSFKKFAKDINVVETSTRFIQIYNEIKSLNSIFEKSHFNLVTLENLLDKLQTIKNNIPLNSTVIIDDINLYNTIYLEFFDKMLCNTAQIEQFLEGVPFIPTLDNTLHITNIEENTPSPRQYASNNVEKLNINVPEISDDFSCVEEEYVFDTNIFKDSPVLFELAKDLKIDMDTPKELIETNPTHENCQINSSSNATFIENTLVISETKGKVILPYKLDELNKILEDHPKKYDCLEDIIRTLYTIPIKYYKNSSISRFREAFKLVKEREHGSFSKALELAFEVISNYNLHPAIITACKTLDELDVYLSCLEYNELNDFHFFKVVFDVAPAVKTKVSKSKLSINY